MNAKRIILIALLIIALLPHAASAASKGNPPVAHWRFDEGGGPTAYDDVGSNDGTLEPGDTSGSNDTAGEMWSTQGKIGGALECDGTNDWVSIGNPSSLLFTDQSFTITAWVKLEDVTTGGIDGIVSRFQGGGWIFVVSTKRNSKKLGVTRKERGEYVTSSSDEDVFEDGTWVHIACVYDRTENILKCYKNGVRLTMDNSTSVDDIVSNGYYYIGSVRDPWSGNHQAKGLIDDVLIYDYARTSDQILVDYTAGAAAHMGAGTDANEGNPPVGYWPLDENTGTNAYDRSGSGNNGTLTGSPAWVQGKFSSALEFDGTSKYVNVLSSDILHFDKDFTVQTWAYIDEFPTTDEAFIVSRGGEYAIVIDETGELLYLVHNTDPGWLLIATNYILPKRTWLHLTLTYSSSYVLKMYVNAQEIYSYNGSGDITNDSVTFKIGRRATLSGDEPFDGKLDNVKIYNYARTQAQIAYDYNKGKPVAHYKFDEGTGSIVHNEYSKADSGAAPVGWWRMDEGTGGTTADSTGNGNTGTLYPVTEGTNTTTADMWDQTGKIGPDCLEFDGTDDYVSAGSVSELKINGDLTVSVWFRANTFGDAEYIVAQGIGGENVADNYLYLFRIDTTSGNDLGYLHEYSAGSDESQIFDVNLSTGTWYHACIVRDVTANTVKLYINGVQGGSTFNYTNDPTGGSDGYFTIGNRYDQQTSPFDGLIDDVRIYNYARTAEQIYNDYKTTHGTMVGDTKFVDGKIGKALEFDGSGDYVDVSDSITIDSPGNSDRITMSAWIKTSTSEWSFFINRYDGSGGDDDWILAVSDTNHLAMFLRSDGSWRQGDDVITDNKWHHVVGVYDGSYILTYVDGILDSQTQVSTTLTDSDIPFRIGGVPGYSYYFTGLIDDVRIYNYARTQAQVLEDYNAGFPVRLGAQSAGEADPWGGAMPVAYWKLDENTGVLARDASENNNDGTLGGDGAGTDVPTWAHGKHGPALSFDADDDYVNIPYSASTLAFDSNDPITIATWIKPTNSQENNSGARIVEQGNEIVLRFATDNNNIDFILNSFTNDRVGTTTNSITVDAWNYVVGVYDGTKIKVYINGIENSSVTPTGTYGGDTSDWHLSAASGSNFSGLIDDVKIYNYARTQAQVAWDYNRGKPLAHWRFDEATSGSAVGTDNIKDDSGNAYHGSGAGSNIAWTTGQFGGGLSFNGTDDYVDVGDISAVELAEVTFSGWIKTDGTNGDEDFLVKGKHVQSQPLVMWRDDSVTGGTDNGNTNTLSVIVYDGSTQDWYSAPSGSLNDTNWHHVAISIVPDSEMKIYIDGVLRRTGDILGNDGIQNTATSLRIGSDSTGSGAVCFDGQIDDVRIYNYIRTAEQIMQDYNQGLAVLLGE